MHKHFHLAGYEEVKLVVYMFWRVVWLAFQKEEDCCSDEEYSRTPANAIAPGKLMVSVQYSFMNKAHRIQNQCGKLKKHSNACEGTDYLVEVVGTFAQCPEGEQCTHNSDDETKEH